MVCAQFSILNVAKLTNYLKVFLRKTNSTIGHIKRSCTVYKLESEKYVGDIIVIGSPKSLINVQKEKEIFVVACLFTSSIKFRERSSGARLRVGPQFAEISARATGILASRPARLLIKNNANFMRQQGMSQASPVKAGQPGNRAGSPRINRP